MKTIRDTKLFRELQEKPEWKTLFTEEKYPELKNPEIPTLAGGLDHIDVKPGGFYFYDIGSSRGGKLVDNSFVIRKETKKDIFAKNEGKIFFIGLIGEKELEPLDYYYICRIKKGKVVIISESNQFQTSVMYVNQLRKTDEDMEQPEIEVEVPDDWFSKNYPDININERIEKAILSELLN